MEAESFIRLHVVQAQGRAQPGPGAGAVKQRADIHEAGRTTYSPAQCTRPLHSRPQLESCVVTLTLPHVHRAFTCFPLSPPLPPLECPRQPAPKHGPHHPSRREGVHVQLMRWWSVRGPARRQREGELRDACRAPARGGRVRSAGDGGGGVRGDRGKPGVREPVKSNGCCHVCIS